jgi:hypothetical protein
MRSTSVALAVAIVSTWTGAHCAEMPDGSNETAALRTDFSIAHPNPHSRSKIVVSDPGAGLAFIAEGAIPMPLLKPPPAWRQPPTETICRLIRSAAREHEIPAGFLTRLIWQESRFRVTAVSHAGAQGIAQFMPATAAERDLEDPFDPRQAVRAAASLLSSLNERFGNLGLAAAAYNAGPGRVSAWLRKRKRLPPRRATTSRRSPAARRAAGLRRRRRTSASSAKPRPRRSAPRAWSRWRAVAELQPLGKLTANSR